MTGRETTDAPDAVGQPLFTTTHWSVVLAAGGDSMRAQEALEQLCRAYWLPLYCYIRRRGYAPEDAQDLTQEFFARLLANGGLSNVDPMKGKFRSFLLVSVNHLLSDERDRARRQKRGGGVGTISFDAQAAEERYRLEPVDERSAERVFERRWAMALVEQVLHRLEAEHVEAGRGEYYSLLKGSLAEGRRALDYAAAARQLSMSEGGVRMAVHRLRQRFGELFRSAVADTVTNPDELEEEMRHLFSALSN